MSIKDHTIKKSERKIEVEQKPAVEGEPLEEITVHYPLQKFNPRQFSSFDVGGMYYKTFVKPGETLDEAHDRAWEYLDSCVRKQYQSVKKLYNDIWKDLG